MSLVVDDPLVFFRSKLQNFVAFAKQSYDVDASSLLAYDPVYVASSIYSHRDKIRTILESRDFREIHKALGLEGTELKNAGEEADCKLWLYVEFFLDMSQKLCKP